MKIIPCPYCGNDERILKWQTRRGLFKCKDCGKYYTERTNINRGGKIINGEAYCTTCDDFKPIEDFYIRNGITRSDCKECIKTKNFLRRRRNLVDDKTFFKMIDEQDNKCKICNRELDSERKSFVDHCHITNMVRGILCPSCNSGLGIFGDNVQSLENAVIYLKESKKTHFNQNVDIQQNNNNGSAD